MRAWLSLALALALALSLSMASASRLQTVALPMRRVSGESPLSVMVESDLCASNTAPGVRSPLHEVVLVVQSTAAAARSGAERVPALLLDNDHVNEVSVMQVGAGAGGGGDGDGDGKNSPDAGRCLVRLCEKRALASRRSSVQLHGRTAEYARFGCASHGRRSAHGIASGPCEGALDIGAASELWHSFRTVSLAHNRLLLSVDAPPLPSDAARLCAPLADVAAQHLCAFGAVARVRDARTLRVVAELGAVRADVDISTPVHRLDARLLHAAGAAIDAAREGAELVLCADTACERVVASVPLHEPHSEMYEGSTVQLDDDDDVLSLDESKAERSRRLLGNYVPVFVPLDSVVGGGDPRIILGSLLLRHYEVSVHTHGDKTRSATLTAHEGRGNLDIVEALVFVVAVAHAAASLCFSAELCGDALARRVARQTRTDAERRRGANSLCAHMLMMMCALALASASAYLLSRRAPTSGGGSGALWAMLALGVGVAALTPSALALAGGRRGAGARLRAMTLLSLAYEQVALAALFAVASVWHEGGPFESLASVAVALCMVGNAARHVQHAADTRVAFASARGAALALLDVLVFGALALQSAFVVAGAVLPATGSAALSLVLLAYAARAGFYVARVNVDAALVRRLQ